MAGIRRCYEVYLEEDGAKRFYCRTLAVSTQQAINNGRHRYCWATFGAEVSELVLSENRIYFSAKLLLVAPKRSLPRVIQPLLPGLTDHLAAFYH